MIRSTLFALSAATTAALLSACAANPPAPSAAPQPVVYEYTSWRRPAALRLTPQSQLASPTPKARPRGTTGPLVLDDRITSACGIYSTAHFAFDSDAIEGETASELDQLAQCFTSGPMAGRKLRIVGHADPRGEHGYNLVLGQKRATGVAFYLNERGVDLLNVHTMSVGNTYAVGTDEDTWALDRKVEVFLDED